MNALRKMLVAIVSFALLTSARTPAYSQEKTLGDLMQLHDQAMADALNGPIPDGFKDLFDQIIKKTDVPRFVSEVREQVDRLDGQLTTTPPRGSALDALRRAVPLTKRLAAKFEERPYSVQASVELLNVLAFLTMDSVAGHFDGIDGLTTLQGILTNHTKSLAQYSDILMATLEHQLSERMNDRSVK